MQVLLPKLKAKPIRTASGVSCNFFIAHFMHVTIGVVFSFLLRDKAIASRAVFVIVSRSDGRAEMLLEPVK